MAGAGVAGVAGTAALAAALAAGGLFYVSSTNFATALATLTKDVADISAKLGEAISKDTKIEVRVPDIKMPSAEKAMSQTFNSVTDLAAELRELSKTMQSWSAVAWTSGVILCLSGATYGIFIWPRQVIRDHIRQTLNDQDAYLEDDEPRVALALLEAQGFNTSLGKYSPLHTLVSDMKFRHPKNRAAISALEYAIMFKTEEDALWLLKNGVVPDLDNAGFHLPLQARMHSVIQYYLFHLGHMRPELIEYYVNEEVAGNSPLSLLLELPPETQWTEFDQSILTTLLSYGATGRPVRRLTDSAMVITLTMEDFVNQTFTDANAKMQVLATLLQSTQAATVPEITEDTPIVNQQPFADSALFAPDTPPEAPDSPVVLKHTLSEPSVELRTPPVRARTASVQATPSSATSHPVARANHSATKQPRVKGQTPVKSGASDVGGGSVTSASTSSAIQDSWDNVMTQSATESDDKET